MTNDAFKSAGSITRWVTLAVVAIILLVVCNPVSVIPAGCIGVKDFFGKVSQNKLQSGIRIIFPFTRVVKMSIKTQELKEISEVPSKEGLIMDLEVSVLYRIDPDRADQIYKGVGEEYANVIVEPQMRSAIREITASYEAKALYSAEREKIAVEIFNLARSFTAERGIIIEQVLLRKIGLPTVVANAIQEKLRREQEAERKRIEAQGISAQLLEWKGIEATEKLAASPNTKIVVIGNTKNGLPIILGGENK